MNKNYHFLKLAAYELNYENDLIKSAGVVDKIVSFVKSILDSDFRAQKQQFEKELSPIKDCLNNIYSISKNIQSAIDAGDFSKYKSELEGMKEQANFLVEKTVDLTKINTKIYQSAADLAKDKTRQAIMDNMPDNYDIPLYKALGKPFKSFNFNKDTNVNDIQIKPSNLKVINKMFEESEMNIKVESNEDKNKLKQAIIDGELVKAELKSFDKVNSKGREVFQGETRYIITSAPISLNDYRFQLKVDVGDQRASVAGVEKLYVIGFIKIIPLSSDKYASKKNAKESQLRPYKVTKINELELANILLKGYQIVFGQQPTLSMLASGWAQNILEAGRPGGVISLPNNNVGNIKATPDWIKSGKPYFIKDTQEFTQKGEFFIEKAAKWRAYNSPEEGAAGYWNLLKNRYGSSLEYFDVGDPISAGVSLGKSGYYTANIEKYSTSVGKIYNEFMKKYADDFANLIPKKDIELPKLEVKNWRSDYQNDKQIKENKPLKEEKVIHHNEHLNENIEQMSEDLYKKLVANDLIISNLIKEASGQNNIFGTIKLTSGSHQDRIKFATVFSALAYKNFNVKSDLKKSNKELDIIFKSPVNQINNLEKLCYEINNKSKNINYFVIPNFISNLTNDVEINEIIL